MTAYGMFFYYIPASDTKMYQAVLNRIARYGLRLDGSVYLINYATKKDIDIEVQQLKAKYNSICTVKFIKIDNASTAEVEALAKEEATKVLANIGASIQNDLDKIEADEKKTAFSLRTKRKLESLNNVLVLFNMAQDFDLALKTVAEIFMLKCNKYLNTK